MGRYKDEDALLEIIDYYILHDEDARKHHSALFVEGMKDGYYRIKSKVLNMPTADVVEVVHGEWIEHDDALVSGHCSVCGWESIICETDVIGMNYCPNCGAKMDKKGEK